MTKDKVYPPEVEVAGEPARVGVFVCNCGLNIGGIADVPALVEYAKEIPDVAYMQANLFSCSQDAQSQMAGDDQGAKSEPGGGGGLQPLHASTHLPGYAAHRRPQ